MSVGNIAALGLPDYTGASGQSGSGYPLALDAAAKVHNRIAGAFAPHSSQAGSPSAPDMTVTIDAGAVLVNGALVSQAAQTSGTITAPSGNPRRDLIVIDELTAALSIVTGSEAASPSDPDLPAGKIPLGRIRLTVGMTVIDDPDIDDLRPVWAGVGSSSLSVQLKYQDFTAGLTDDVLYVVDPSTGSPSISSADCYLPSAGSVASGFKVRVKNATDGYGVRILPDVGSPTDVIDGQTSYRVPGRATVEATRTAAGTWTLTREPPHMVGEVIEWGTNTLPVGGWAWVNGQALSRTEHRGLFDVWGTTYGSGDGSTTFNVRDDRGRVKAGRDTMAAAAAGRLTSGGSGIDGTTLGASGGTQTHTLTTGEIPAHAHGTNYQNSVGGSGNDNYVVSDGSSLGTRNTQSTGGGGAHQNTQPTITCNFIVKT